MNTDPIADFLTRIRNASSAGLKTVDIPGSNTKRAMTQILFDQGYITNFKFEDDNKQGNIKIALKYNASTKVLQSQNCKELRDQDFVNTVQHLICHVY